MTAILVFCFLLTNRYHSKLAKDQKKLIQKHDVFAKDVAEKIAPEFIKGNFEATLTELDSLTKKKVDYAFLFDSKGILFDGIVNQKLESSLISQKRSEIKTKTDAIKRITSNIDLRAFDVVRIKLLSKSQEKHKMYGGLELAFVFPYDTTEKIFLYHIWIAYLILSCLLLGTALSLAITAKRSVHKGEPQEKAEEVTEESDKAIQSEELGIKTEDATETPKDESVQSEGTDILSMEVAKDFEVDTAEFGEEDFEEEGWLRMFDGWDIDDWLREGTWYVSDGLIVGAPWKASLVKNDIDEKNYEFKLKAKKITGKDGFVVIFQCSDKCHAWIIGGWNNTRSEVIRAKETSTNDTVDTDRWHEIRISVDPEKVTGFLNKEEIWSLKRKILEELPSQNEFLHGIGIGVWSTLCKYGDIKLRKK